MMFVRPDFRRPSTTKEVGPSAATRFHGGETSRGDDLCSCPATFRFFAGGPSLEVLWVSSGSTEGAGGVDRGRDGDWDLSSSTSSIQLVDCVDCCVLDEAYLDVVVDDAGCWSLDERRGSGSASGA